MRIAIDIRTAGGMKAGKGWYTFNIVRELLKIDKHSKYTLYANGGIAGFEEFKNAEVKIINGKGLLWHLKTYLDIRKQKPDIFFAPSSFIIPAILPKSQKTIITVHDLVAFLFPSTHNKKAVILEKIFLKRAVKRAKAIIAISENTKKDIIEKTSTTEEKISIVPCSASEIFFPIDKPLEEFRKKTGLPNKFFLSVSTIEPRKNYDTLIQALAMLHEKNIKSHLLIVGKKGWGTTDLEDLIRENYLQKYVHLLGYVTNKTLNKLYNLSEGFVFPSYYEGFGIPPLEAMQCGCPVISSHTSSLPEVIGDAGIFCDPSSPAEFAKAMEDVASDENLRTELINKGRIQSKKFSWADSAQKLYKLLKNT
jgi:glycosyltransferase involved in cell wall biosynthesis